MKSLINWFKEMELVDDWKSAWRWFSMNCMGLATVIEGTWVGLSDDIRQQLPKDIAHIMAIAVLITGMFGRLVNQQKKDDTK